MSSLNKCRPGPDVGACRGSRQGQQCPACGTQTTRNECCGIHLAGPFAMSRQRVIALRRYAHGRKGLDEDTYRMHVRAVGVESTLHLARDQYDALLKRLRGLPDRPRQQGRAAACTR